MILRIRRVPVPPRLLFMSPRTSPGNGSRQGGEENGRAGIANHRRNQLDFVDGPRSIHQRRDHLIDALRKAREVAARVRTQRCKPSYLTRRSAR